MLVRIKSFAKINIGLYIGPPGLRRDNFHELRTVYQTIALHDRLTVELSKGRAGIELHCDDPRVPTDASNTCWKAAERTMAALKLSGRVKIVIDKRLPVQGGMGAASGNAVATILGIERAARKRLDPAERMRIAEQVGSDVPLFLIGGTVLGVGRGEQVYPLPDLPTLDLVVATPEIGVSTPKAFAAWDHLFSAPASRAELPPEQPTTAERRHEANQLPEGTRAQLLPNEPTFLNRRKPAKTAPMTQQGLTVSAQSGKLDMFSRQLYGCLAASPLVSGVSARGGNRAEALLLDLVRTGIANDFERVVFDQFPALRQVKQALEREGSAYASLSGSGSTVYGIFRSRAAAEKAARDLGKKGIPASVARTLPRKDYWRRMFV
ncbi:MAG: 4-(cytidine 5'-diphospho)-2-C-methyl-D-erythritol kinase [Acidobacteriales bacterium]|nr:4-(cytidine 5'-diphospho)-2-C-methyl-D-erythritol kinase [Terriglobales bacterium]